MDTQYHLVPVRRTAAFSELRHDIPGVSAKVLTQRLREMEELGVVLRRVMPTSPPSVEYELTELGREFQPVIEAIIAAGRRLKDNRRADAA